MPNRSPLVSVCIPTFNRAGMLRESVASVLGQDFEDLELIISDNASADDTESVVRSFNNDRILYVKNSQNVGPRGNMNRCLRLSRGKYIAFLPDDDMMMPDNLGKKVAFLEANPEVGLVHSRYHLVDRSGRIVKTNTNWGHGPVRTLDSIEDRRELLACIYNRINLPTVLFRKACHEKLGEFTSGCAGELGLAFDYEYWMRIALCYKVAYLAKALVKWRIHDDSLTNTCLAADETRKLMQLLAAKRLLLTTYSRDIPEDLRREILDRATSAVLLHAGKILEKEVPSESARLFLLESTRMFPGILSQKETWKLMLKSMVSRQSIERLKRFAPT